MGTSNVATVNITEYLATHRLEADVRPFPHPDKLQLSHTLTLAFSKIDLTEEQTVTVKTADSLRVLKLSDIVCCEYRSHSVIVTLTEQAVPLVLVIFIGLAAYGSIFLSLKNLQRERILEVISMNNRLRDLREDEELNQTQIAKYLGMSQTGYSKYETGENDIPTQVLIKLAQYYKTRID